MINLNYATINAISQSLDGGLARWADARETDVAVAAAIHAISDSTRSPDAIWENPTDAVAASVEGRDMTTYTILENGQYTSGIDLIEAADILLGNDGHQHEIRQDDDGGWRLWVSQYSRNSTLGGRPLIKSVIYTPETNEKLAARDIAEKVIGSGRWETGDLRCMTDEQGAAEIAELADEEGQ